MELTVTLVKFTKIFRSNNLKRINLQLKKKAKEQTKKSIFS